MSRKGTTTPNGSIRSGKIPARFLLLSLLFCLTLSFVLLPPDSEAAGLAAPNSQAKKGDVRVSFEQGQGLNRVIFSMFQVATIFANLPGDMAPGEVVAGTIFVEPYGKDAERDKNLKALQKFVVKVGDKSLPLSTKTFQLTLGPAQNATPLTVQLIDDKGKVVGHEDVAFGPQPPPPSSEVSLPPTAKNGGFVTVLCPCDGMLAGGDSLKVGGKEVLLLAESSRQRIALNTSDVLGSTQSEFSENGKVTRGEIRNIQLVMRASITNLTRGQTTTMSVEVRGLENLTEEIPLLLQNRTPGILSMSGGDTQALTIRPSDVRAGGVFTTERTLTGITVGAFFIDGIVTWTRPESSAAFSRQKTTAENPPVPGAPASGDTPGNRQHPEYTSRIEQDRWNNCDQCQGADQRCVDNLGDEGGLLFRMNSPSGVALSQGEFFARVADDGINPTSVSVACPSCGPTGTSLPPTSQMPRVRLQRILRSTFDYPGSFGFKMYSGYDYSVTRWVSGERAFIKLQDPNSGTTETFSRRANSQERYELVSTPDHRTRIVEVTDSHITFLVSGGQNLRFEWTAFKERDGRELARPQSITDRNGNRISFAYLRPATDVTRDAFKWTTISDAYGRKLQFGYSAWEGLNVVDRVTLPDGRTVRYSYDTSINELFAHKVEYGGGIESTFTYQALKSVQNEALLPANHYQHEVLLSGVVPGRTRSIKRADGTLLYSRFDQDQNGVNVSLIYHKGETLELKSSSKKALLSHRQQRVDGTWEMPTTFTAADHRPVDGISQPGGQSWRATRDDRERITGRTYPDGTSESFTYNEFSQITSYRHRSGAVENWKYDAAGNLLTHTEATGVTGVEASERWTYNGRGQVLTHTDFNGNVTLYGYRPDGELSTITLPSSEGQPAGTVTFAYDPAGNVAGITDPANRTVSYKYDAIGRAVKTTYGDGSTEENIYGTREFSARLLSAKDRNENRTLYTYDDTGRVLTIRLEEARSRKILSTIANTWDRATGRLLARDVDGSSTEYSYDHKGRVLTTTVWPQAGRNLTTTNVYDQHRLLYTLDPYGRKTAYTYDLMDRIKTTSVELTPGGQTIVTANDYDAEGRLKARTDPNGVRDEYEYDGRNRSILTRHAAGTPVEVKESYTYDGNNNQLTFTDGNGHTWKKTYTARNQSRTDADPLGNTSTYAYTAEGLTQSVANANQHAIRYVYANCCGRVSQKIDADENTASYEYDPNGNLIKTTDESGRTVAYEYDGLNRQTKVTIDPSGLKLQTVTAYDATPGAIGRKETLTNPAGQVVTVSYDALDRVSSVTGDTPNLIHLYDVLDNGFLKVTTTDANRNSRSTLSDGAGRTVKTIDGLNNTTAMTYDGNGNLKSSIDRDGRRTRYDYDARNRRVAIVNDEGGIGAVTRYQYDAADNLLRITDATGNVTAYVYDAANHRTSATHAFGASEAKTWSYAYSPTGQLKREQKPNGVITEYSYDNLERLARRAYSTGGADTFSYHANGLLKTAIGGLYRTTLDRSNLDADYDRANRVRRERQDIGTGPKTVAYTYRPDNLISEITYPGGVTMQQTFTPRRELFEVKLGGTTQATHTYDAAGRLQSRTYANGTTAKWVYDNNDRITRLDHVNVQAWDYRYTPEGDVLARSDLTTPDRGEAFVYDGLHRLVDYKQGRVVGDNVPSPASVQKWTLDKVGNWMAWSNKGANETRTHNALNELNSINGAAITHDDGGNLKEDQVYKYEYDEEDRLKSVTRKADNVVVGQYKYDALGRRILKVTNVSGTPNETRYFYHGQRIIEEQDASGATQATYTYGSYIDEVLTMNRGKQTYYYHQNALWSIAAVTDRGAKILERYTYAAYGNPTVADGAGKAIGEISAIGNHHLFTGRQLDGETGLYFYRARYFDPYKGRFSTRDPIGAWGDQNNMGNSYAYVGSNPLLNIDPSGTKWVTGTGITAKICGLVSVPCSLCYSDVSGSSTAYASDELAANACAKNNADPWTKDTLTVHQGDISSNGSSGGRDTRLTWPSASTSQTIALIGSDRYKRNIIFSEPEPPLPQLSFPTRSSLSQALPVPPPVPDVIDCFKNPWHPGCRDFGIPSIQLTKNSLKLCSR